MALDAANNLLSDNQQQLAVGRMPPIEVARTEALVAASEIALTQANSLRQQQENVPRSVIDPQSLSTPAQTWLTSWRRMHFHHCRIRLFHHRRRGPALRHESARRNHHLRYRLGGRLAPKRSHSTRLPTDVASEMQAVRDRYRPYSGDGHLELFKTTKKYDGKVGREQHRYPPSEELPL